MEFGVGDGSTYPNRFQIEQNSSTTYLHSNLYYSGGYKCYDTGRAAAGIRMTCLNGDSHITFYTYPTNNAAPSERMRVTKGGNLLIGTTDDGTNKLQVNGGAAISGDLTVTGASTNFRNAVKAIDGSGSGVDADYIDGRSSATFWGSDNDGSGSGLDADTVDGYAPSTSGTANTLVLRDASGGINASGTIRTSGEISGQTVSFGGMTGFSGYIDDTFKNGMLMGTGNRLVYSTSTGVLTNSSSDARMKRNVNTISNALNKVLSLRGVYYHWKNRESDKLGNQREMGMIAQEVEKVIPEVVGTNKTGMKSLDYPKIVAVLVEAIKELDKLRKSDNAALLRKIEKQEREIDELKSAIKAIQAKLH